MASTFGRVSLKSLRVRCPHRAIHLTPILQKKGNAEVVIDDLFAEDAFVGDLIEDSTSGIHPPGKATPTRTSARPKGTRDRKGRPLSPTIRLERLNNLLSFMGPRIGKKPETKLPLLRKSSWLTLLDLPSNEEQMHRVIELLPKYKDGKGEFPDGFAEAFTRRCQELSCPQLALTVFGDFAKYNLMMTLPAARWLVHSLYVKHPISQTFLAASLYPSYGLPQISEDLPTATMIAAACYNHKHKTEETIKVAEALLPYIQKMFTDAQGGNLDTAKTLEDARVNKWVAWALRRLNTAMKREKGETIVPTELVPSRIKINGSSNVSHLNVYA